MDIALRSCVHRRVGILELFTPTRRLFKMLVRAHRPPIQPMALGNRSLESARCVPVARVCQNFLNRSRQIFLVHRGDRYRIFLEQKQLASTSSNLTAARRVAYELRIPVY